MKDEENLLVLTLYEKKTPNKFYSIVGYVR